jgi:uncharacterized protein YqeY
MTPEADAPVTLQARLEAAVRDAMRARDERRTALAAAHNQRIARGRALTDEEITEVVGREVKTRRESIDVYRGAGREDRAAAEEAEVEILSEFLPEQLTDEAIEALARAAIAETGASGPGDTGKVMGRVAPQTKGRADGRRVSDIVRRLLTEA